jgi:alanine racemase
MKNMQADLLCHAYINLDALQHNYHQVKRLAPTSKVIAMIKGDGYGHGLLSVASALTDADAFGVARLHEAVQLRHAGICQPIVILEGWCQADELNLIEQYALDVAIHQPWQMSQFLQCPQKTPRTVWLKIDTGMHRLGVPVDQVVAIWQQLRVCTWVGEIHFMTHFSRADEINVLYTKQQMDCFYNAVRELPGQRSLANSAAILGWPDSHADWVRPGIMLYGVSPFALTTGVEHELKPVMTLMARLIAVREAHRGDFVGYGSTWQCPEDMLIGVASIGYGDGYPRYIKNGAPVLVNGKKASIAGRVSMDMITLDLRGHHDPKIGDPVTLWGDDLPIETIAHWANTSPYELLCGLSRRVQYCKI